MNQEQYNYVYNLIQQERRDEARAQLIQFPPNDPQAQYLLNLLGGGGVNQPNYGASPYGAQPAYGQAAGQSLRNAGAAFGRGLGAITAGQPSTPLSRLHAAIVGTALFLMATFITFGFFFANWWSSLDGTDYSPLEITLGADLENTDHDYYREEGRTTNAITLDIQKIREASDKQNDAESESEHDDIKKPGGFDDVRLIDRLLLFLPIFGGVLMFFTFSYMRKGSRGSLMAALVIFAVLLGLTFLWEMGSSADFGGAVSKSLLDDYDETDVDSLSDEQRESYDQRLEESMANSEEGYATSWLKLLAISGIVISGATLFAPRFE